jgi:hypothetical protein
MHSLCRPTLINQSNSKSSSRDVADPKHLGASVSSSRKERMNSSNTTALLGSFNSLESSSILTNAMGGPLLCRDFARLFQMDDQRLFAIGILR